MTDFEDQLNAGAQFWNGPVAAVCVCQWPCLFIWVLWSQICKIIAECMWSWRLDTIGHYAAAI